MLWRSMMFDLITIFAFIDQKYRNLKTEFPKNKKHKKRPRPVNFFPTKL